LFASRKASTLLNALKNRGVPAKDRGLTGPIVINEYCLLATSNAECGSLNNWYRFKALPEDPTSCLKAWYSCPKPSPNPKKNTQLLDNLHVQA
jgi:hypothetical protein